MIRSGDRLARFALRAASNISRILSASQLGVTLASLGLGWVAEETVGEIFVDFFGHLPFAIEMSLRLTLGATMALIIVTYCSVLDSGSKRRAHHLETGGEGLPLPAFFAWIPLPPSSSIDRPIHLSLFGQQVRIGKPSLSRRDPPARRASQESVQMQAHDGRISRRRFRVLPKRLLAR